MSVPGIQRLRALGATPSHSIQGATRSRTSQSWRALLALACLTLATWLPAPAVLAQEAGATLESLAPSDEPIAAQVRDEVALAVVRRQDGAGIAGAKVDWTVEGPEGATLAPDQGITTNATDADGAGIARTRFRARADGHYVVTASSQANPGCFGEGCAQFVRASFEIDVAAAATADDGDNAGRSNKWVGGIATAAAAVALLSSGGGNDNDDDGTSSGTGQTLAINTGNGQQAQPNQPLPGVLSVKASNDGNPAANVTINWSASGGAVLNTSSTTTNSFGLAAVVVTSVGPGPAPITITATRADSGATVTFTAVVLTPELQMVSGNFQSAPTSTQVPNPLVVRALLGGATQANVLINWTIVSGDASIASVSNGGLTDGSGQSSAVINLGPTAGTVTVQAARNDFPTITQTFTINSTLTRTLFINGGNNQTAPPN
ncbi:MAG: Ig-like domain-containing protein, partial [Alphaproteobacteria bacterium]